MSKNEILLNALRTEEQDLLSQLEAVRTLISKHGGAIANKGSFITVTNTVVDPPQKKEVKESGLSKYSDSEKFLVVLKTHNRFMKVREVAKYLTAEIGGEEDAWVKSLSRRTPQLKKAGQIVPFKVGSNRGNVFWGAKKWMNEDGSIKEGHGYDKNSLSKRKGNLTEFDFD